MNDTLFLILVILIICNIGYFIFNCNVKEKFDNITKQAKKCHTHPKYKRRPRVRRYSMCRLPPYYMPPQQYISRCNKQEQIDNAIKEINDYCKRQKYVEPKANITKCVKKCESYKPIITKPLPTRCKMECNKV